MTEQQLSALFDRLRGGDSTAFEELYHGMKTPLYTVICRVVHHRETAEDIMQELFLKLYRSPPEQAVNKKRAWIYRMACNLAIDALRRREHAELTEDILPSDGSMAERIGLRLDLERAMAALPLEEREVAALHLGGGLTFREITAATGLSLPAVYRRYRKAIAALRGALNGGTV